MKTDSIIIIPAPPEKGIVDLRQELANAGVRLINLAQEIENRDHRIAELEALVEELEE